MGAGFVDVRMLFDLHVMLERNSLIGLAVRGKHSSLVLVMTHSY